jgi:uncharacterized protein
MKKSKYNFFVKNGDRTICFNAVSGKVFSVNQKELYFLQGLLNNPLKQDEYSDLVQWLCVNHFLVDSRIDEFKDFLEKNRRDVLSNHYYLILNPTLECNFSCWYCYEKHPKGHMSDSTIDNIKQYVENLLKNHEISGLTLSWFGGEPLLYFDEIVFPLSLHFKNCLEKNKLPFNQTITTNGYLICEKMIEKFNGINMQSFQITLDGDREMHDNTRNNDGMPSFDIIVKNIISLCKNLHNPNITLRINYTNEIIKKDFGLILSIFPKDVRNKIQVQFQRVWQTMKYSAKCNEDIQRNINILRSMGFFAIPNNIYSINRTHACYADRYNYAHINYDGLVYKCTARDYSDERSVGKLIEGGKINWRSDAIEKMYHKANFENNNCCYCKKLPICGGPCLQNTLDARENNSVCIGKYKEMDVNAYIREYYYGVRLKHNMCNYENRH